MSCEPALALCSITRILQMSQLSSRGVKWLASEGYVTGSTGQNWFGACHAVLMPLLGYTATLAEN